MTFLKKMLLAIGLVFSVVACGNEKNRKTIPTEPVKDKFTDKIQLNWVLDEAYYKHSDSKIFAYLNQLLDEKGYDFIINPVPAKLNGAGFIQSLKKMKDENKPTDIICTGYQLGTVTEFSMYSEAVAQKLLYPLDSLFSEEKVKCWQEFYPEQALEMMRRDGKIYGVTFNHFGDSLYSAALNRELMEQYNVAPLAEYSFMGYLDKLAEIKEKAEQNGNGIGAPDIEISAICTELGYFRYRDFWLKEGKDGKIEFANPYEDPDVIDYLIAIRRFWEQWNGKNGIAESSLSGSEGESGYYRMLPPTMSYGNQSLYYPAYTYEPERNIWIYRIEDDDIGIASWSEHPQEAFEFLTLLATDSDVANLLYYGVYGVAYELVDGCARRLDTSEYEGVGLGSYGNVNMAIVYPEDCEPRNKVKVFREHWNYISVYPQTLVNPYDWKMSAKEEEIAQVFKRAELLWLGECENPKEYAEEICVELQQKGAYDLFQSKNDKLYAEDER